ncbi:hypothetical protein GOP47_0029724 [Adiantum capillus-veneris]|nr:hypothetical protein GOP47_0029724 [Adiantum capillus-veneris]
MADKAAAAAKLSQLAQGEEEAEALMDETEAVGTHLDIVLKVDARSIITVEVDPAAVIQQIREIFRTMASHFNSTRVVRDEAIKGIRDHFRAAVPTRNVVVIHTQHVHTLLGLEHSHMVLQTGIFKKVPVDIYVFKSGVLTNLGDGGFINWAWGGYVTEVVGKRVHFRLPPGALP